MSTRQDGWHANYKRVKVADFVTFFCFTFSTRILFSRQMALRAHYTKSTIWRQVESVSSYNKLTQLHMWEVLCLCICMSHMIVLCNNCTLLHTKLSKVVFHRQVETDSWILTRHNSYDCTFLYHEPYLQQDNKPTIAIPIPWCFISV